ncbi:protein TIFY 4B [Solanum lycopersicum]|uniref:Protein TIFY n=1 Tax=Solanum lycopersicum TaxID=4081 RepID=K4CAR7_SOLLC|nr:protein TIFY 4B isoform X1 [Solanum lycopersicum]AKN91685.1 BIG SEEDS 1 [Solanum lycopersicum]
MPPEETVSKSPLDKPLNQLTDDDISQLTREDCRRYLKQKGMRKPSWNKSQAIQQVISLKALLEPDTDAGSRKKLHIPRADTHVQRGKNTYGEPSEPVPDRRNQQDKPDLSNHSTALPVTVVDNSAPSRTIGSADKPVGQMTIFYRGKVNVYDDVPADKAQKIMCLASSPLCMPSETPSNATAAARHSAYCLQAANSKLRLDTVKMSEVSRVPIEESNRLCNDNPGAVESPASRKASVQRYLEKRKERFKWKRKVETTSSANLDIYLSDRIGTCSPSDYASGADLSFPPHITPTGSGPIQDNIQMNPTFSSGLNDRDVRK